MTDRLTCQTRRALLLRLDTKRANTDDSGMNTDLFECLQRPNQGAFGRFGPAPLVLACFLAWSLTTSSASAAPPASPLEKARQALLKAAEEGTCSSDSQCQTLPAGSSLCGGPSLWVVFADELGRKQRLSSLAENFNRAEQAERQAAPARSGVGPDMGICTVLPAPQTRCLAHRCTAVANDLLLR